MGGEAEIRTLLLSLHSKVDVLAERVEGVRAEQAKHDSDIEKLKERRWPAAMIGIVTSVAALALALFTRIQTGS
jgi:hypothetical protein